MALFSLLENQEIGIIRKFGRSILHRYPALRIALILCVLTSFGRSREVAATCKLNHTF